MRARRTFAILAASCAAWVALVAALPLVRASDHLDGPRVTADRTCDITDVFAFTSPENPGRVVLAMTLNPYATDASTFSPLVDYAFRVQLVQVVNPLTLDMLPHDVVCEFGAGSPQTVTCTAPGGLAATATVGDTGGGSVTAGHGSMRVFAGLRSDPAFFDRQGALATIASGRASFTGQNAFAGANVLAVVVEVDSSVFTLSLGPDGGAVAPADGGREAGPPKLAVAAETFRRGM
jgi:hypothetical protein